MTLQDIVMALKTYWKDQGCLIAEPYDIEVGAGTMSPSTFFGALGPDPWKVAYVQPSRRPVDARYGENPNRVYQHHQFQVLLKPAPDDVVEQYLRSLEAIGLDRREHDIRFVEDNWEAPSLGAWGLGWEVWLDGMEISQFTYFQQMGGQECRPVAAELTYGLERLASYLVGADEIWTIEWAPGVTYDQLFRRAEWEHATYSFEQASSDVLFQLFALYESEAKRLLSLDLIRPGYEYLLKASHIFNTLDALGAISVTERQAYLGRLRTLSRLAATRYLDLRTPKKQEVLS
ncbi:MAG: glycine--tRNA ligase subunit alpha [Sulfobacillus thermosulfidooxidans]|uniref:Glycine--tRNA ligase alpha subunit n=1 Tax=Sulfobacillus thermotolerans TaxID=338644 RepID=A0ABM6RPG8_9FIRM|nr:glycine--tRNA ligase subunit alpha [Sulfobacillus sp. hq2]AUW93224.1 glycine--tRNA ligase subunit alpha [Sulfobacillus thermotolerans]MCY0906869.1 glycine--tRNA ligase subunit alpha [Sulfobacillus thermotolerans]POB11699.1 glycine--tRNA ligase subunit alpha [Sulfobacillus sp. hq2]PSR36981.1 MAG: glycine--tRNA ligase subunit alpha [Sulfobacillus thermosulfidooxidans]